MPFDIVTAGIGTHVCPSLPKPAQMPDDQIYLDGELENKLGAQAPSRPGTFVFPNKVFGIHNQRYTPRLGPCWRNFRAHFLVALPAL